MDMIPESPETNPQALDDISGTPAENNPFSAPAPAWPTPPGSEPLNDATPPFAPQTPPPFSPPPPKKVRRVGTITMALCLIGVGSLLILRLLLPWLNYRIIAQLSPIVLILLGLEMLLATARKKDEVLRFDALSVFVSLLLIGASLFAAVVPEYINNEFTSRRVSDRLTAELTDSTLLALQDEPDLNIYSLQWYLELDRALVDEKMAPADLRPEHYVQIRVYMPEAYANKEDFAKQCRKAADFALKFVPHIDYASFYSTRESDPSSYEGYTIYSMWIDNRYLFADSAEQWAAHVETSYWNEENRWYISEWEYEEMLEAQKQAAMQEEDSLPPEDADSFEEEPVSEPIESIDAMVA